MSSITVIGMLIDNWAPAQDMHGPNTTAGIGVKVKSSGVSGEIEKIDLQCHNIILTK